MASFKFNLTPRKVDEVDTKHRRIRTLIPTPQSLEIINELREYESTNAIEQLPVIWDKAINHQIYDPYGNIWIDFTSSIFVTNSGHGNKDIVDKINQFTNKPLTHSYYYPTEVRLEFLKKLIRLCGGNFNKAILLSAGTEATERAIKIVKLYGKSKDIAKPTIIAWEGNYHGKTLNAQMISGQYNDHKWIDYFDPNIIHLPFPYPWLEVYKNKTGEEIFFDHLKLLESKGLELNNIAGFFVESFQGWGAIFYPKDYIQALRNWAYKNNSLMVFDEIQAGFGRTGKMFAYEHYEVDADLVICGKGISGSLPLSAVLGKSELIELDSAYTSTHGGHPLSCASGIGNLEIFEDKAFLSSVNAKGKVMRERLESWKNKYPERVTMILGKGLLYGIFINDPRSGELDINLTNIICERAMEKGVFSICTGRGTLKLGPPLTIPEEAIIEGLEVYEECFEELF